MEIRFRIMVEIKKNETLQLIAIPTKDFADTFEKEKRRRYVRDRKQKIL